VKSSTGAGANADKCNFYNRKQLHNVVASSDGTVNKNTEDLVKFDVVLTFEICKRTDKHTDTLIAILRTPISGEQ